MCKKFFIFYLSSKVFFPRHPRTNCNIPTLYSLASPVWFFMPNRPLFRMHRTNICEKPYLSTYSISFIPSLTLRHGGSEFDVLLVLCVTKVRINLGAGESELASPSGLTLNDLTWHEVNITRREANITLQIDVIHTTRSILPGRFFELNIHYGVYIGGLGYFNELFLGKLLFFAFYSSRLTSPELSYTHM